MSQPLLLIYGQGGHQTEMSLLLKVLSSSLELQKDDNKKLLEVITLGPKGLNFPANVVHLNHFEGADVRHKHSRLETLLSIIPNNFSLIANTIRIYRRYHLAGVISTGPGLAILPMLILRLLGVKTVFVETYCRFNTRSFTGRVMSMFAHRFLVQNKSQVDLYDNAEYCGRL